MILKLLWTLIFVLDASGAPQESEQQKNEG
jgi:hypothetical protein